MRRYESLWVVNGDLPDEEVKSAIDKFSRIISSQGGTVVAMEAMTDTPDLSVVLRCLAEARGGHGEEVLPVPEPTVICAVAVTGEPLAPLVR